MTKRFLSVAAILSMLVASGVMVAAHAHLEKTEPVEGATIAKAPEHIQLVFNSKIDVALSSIELAGPAGKVALGETHGMDEDKTLMAVVKGDLANGGYTVTWQTASADGHPAKGTFAFIMKKAETH